MTTVQVRNFMLIHCFQLAQTIPSTDRNEASNSLVPLPTASFSAQSCYCNSDRFHDRMQVVSESQEQSLLGRVFDQYQNLMQIARCVREAARQLKIDRLRVLEVSRRDTTLGDYLSEAEMHRYATHEHDVPTLMMPVALPFPDKSFDVCIVSDCYEHLPISQRPGLLAEMLRVTEGLVLVGCPMKDDLVTRFDRIAFDFIWGKYAEQFVPLAQHDEFGLEPLEQVLDSFTTQGASGAVALPGNYVYRWIHQILIYFDLQHRHPNWDLFESINRIYNERLGPYDYREPCYHYLIAVATSPSLNVDVLSETLRGPCETPETVRAAEGALIEAFRAVDSRASDALRKSGETITELHRNAEWATTEIASLRALVAELNRNAEWAAKEIALLRAQLTTRQRRGEPLRRKLGRLAAAVRRSLLQRL